MAETPIRHVRRTSPLPRPREARHRESQPPSVLRARTVAEQRNDREADREWRRKSRWHAVAFAVSALAFVVAVWAVALPLVASR